MSDLATIRRQLKIKTGVVNRMAKENKMNRDDAAKQKLVVEEAVIKAKAGEEHEADVRAKQKVLDEAQRSIVDSESRLGKYVEDLREIVIRAREEPGLKEDPDLAAAEAALANANT